MNIIKFKSNSDNLVDFIDSAKNKAKEDKIDNIIICWKDKKNKEICTGYYNLEAGEKQELLGHIQADIIDNMIRVNIDRYIEEI